MGQSNYLTPKELVLDTYLSKYVANSFANKESGVKQGANLVTSVIEGLLLFTHLHPLDHGRMPLEKSK